MSTLTAVLAQAAGHGSGGSKSPWAFLAVGVVFVLIGATQAFNPQLLWRMNRWAYKNPDANEPSAAAFTVRRVAGVVAAIVGVVLIVVAITKF